MDLIAHLHFAGLRDGAPAFDPVDLVLFEQELDAAGVAVDGFALVGQHLLPIHGRRFALEAHLSKVVLGLMQHVAGVQERFGGDAAHVQAGAAQGFTALNAGGFEAKLGAADRGDVAAGARADHDDIIAGHGGLLWSEGLF